MIVLLYRLLHQMLLHCNSQITMLFIAIRIILFSPRLDIIIALSNNIVHAFEFLLCFPFDLLQLIFVPFAGFAAVFAIGIRLLISL